MITRLYLILDILLEDNPIVVMAAEKKGITTTFGKLLWKNATMFLPSPESQTFIFV